MEHFVTKQHTRIFATASDTSARIGEIPKGTRVEGEIAADPEWVAVMGPPPGFVLRARLRPDVEPAALPMNDADRDQFCIAVTNAARQFGADRDYLMALAVAQSNGINNDVAGDAIGPFRFTRALWDGLVAEHGAANGVTSGAVFDWSVQPAFAALLAHQDTARLASALQRVPIWQELYFAVRFGADAAAAMLVPAMLGNRFATAFQAGFPGQPVPATGLAGNATVQMVADALGDALGLAMPRAAAIIDRQAADIRFVHGESGDPPWLTVARQELAQGIVEFPGPASNPRIAEYHRVAGTTDSSDDVPWCAAFVTFCMLESGDPAARAATHALAGPKQRASSWKEWGVKQAEPSLGSVVVLKKQAPASSGHVGFFMGLTASGAIRLLAGNQGNPNRVGIEPFPADQVVATRGLTAAAATPAPVGVAPANVTPVANGVTSLNLTSVRPDRRPMALLIIDRFARAGFGRLQQAAALANAIGESALDPRLRHLVPPPNQEDSVGLFQLNRIGGVGDGSSVEQLEDPDFNIAKIIEETKRRAPEFASATTIDAAVDVFVRKVERPKDKVAAINTRLAKAKELLA